MSRITKFLRQKCTLEQCLRDSNNEPELNDYGEIVYKFGVVVPCRREASFKDVQTAEGSIIRATSAYYLDDRFKVAVNDKIDGKVIVSVADYINSQGRNEGYEVLV